MAQVISSQSFRVGGGTTPSCNLPLAVAMCPAGGASNGWSNTYVTPSENPGYGPGCDLFFSELGFGLFHSHFVSWEAILSKVPTE